MEQQFDFRTRFARRFADPVFSGINVERHILFLPVQAVPKGLPLDPNARSPKISRRVYRDIEKSLLNFEGEANTFHLKHKGIVVVAADVQKVQRDGDDHYIVAIDDGQGILDGGHTYTLITMDREEPLPENQWVKFEILTNLPAAWTAEVSGGLNTSVQVQPMSLDNLAGRFEWMKEELKNEPCFGDIAWKEGDDGVVDARDLVALLTCFNIFDFPNDGDEQPVLAYEKKSSALQLFEAHPDAYLKLRPIFKDILQLHDIIRKDFRTIWNTETRGKAAHFAFVDDKKRGEFLFPFTRERARYQLMNGALYPMLAAFRWMVEEDGKNGVRWRGGFDAVLTLWRESAAELLRMTQQASTELARNPNAIGKSRNHWANLHARVAKRELMMRAKS